MNSLRLIKPSVMTNADASSATKMDCKLLVRRSICEQTQVVADLEARHKLGRSTEGNFVRDCEAN